MLTGAGHVSVGGAITRTVKEHDCVPHKFDAVQVTVVVPTGKVEPDERSHETDVPKPPLTGAG
jgi:hypothetical protein